MGAREDRVIEGFHVLHTATGTPPVTLVVRPDRPWSTRGFEVGELFWK